MAAVRRAVTLADYFPLSRLSMKTHFHPTKSLNHILAPLSIPITAKQKETATPDQQHDPGPSGSATVRVNPNQTSGIKQNANDEAFPRLNSKNNSEEPQPPLAPNGPKGIPKYFREAVLAQWSKSIDVSLSPSTKAMSSYMGEPALYISEEEEARLAKSFQFALIGKFSRERPSMEIIRQAILAVGFSGECHVGLIDYRHIIFQFQLQSDFNRMWLKNSWTFGGFSAKIFRWSPDFCPGKESSVMPVWITFPLLPVHLSNKELLFTLGTAVGTSLKLDLATAAMDKVLRPSTARLCVEVNLLNDLLNRVWIEAKGKGYWQPISYENLPKYCSSCSKIGHLTSLCKNQQTHSKVHTTKVWVPKNQGQNAGCHEPTKVADGTNHQSPKEYSEVDRPKEKRGENSQQLENGDINLDNFLANLGQFLEIINSQEEVSSTLNQTEKLSLVTRQPPIDGQKVPETPNIRMNMKVTNGKMSGDEGKLAVMRGERSLPKLEIIKAIPTMRWGGGQWLEEQIANFPKEYSHGCLKPLKLPNK